MISSYQDYDNLLHYPQGTDTALKILKSSSPVFLIPVKRETTLFFGAWIDYLVAVSLGFPGGSDSKESTSMQETWVQSLNQEDPLEKGKATHSSTLAWRIPWVEESGRLQSMGLQRDATE